MAITRWGQPNPSMAKGQAAQRAAAQKVAALFSTLKDPAAEAKALAALSPQNQAAFKAYNAQRMKQGYHYLPLAQWQSKSGATAGTAGQAATPDQYDNSLGATLTPDQQLSYFQQTQGAGDQLKNADYSDSDALAAHDAALAQLNQQRAQSAQRATDELIARGLIGAGGQAGAASAGLADIEAAAEVQRGQIAAALKSTQLRNNAVRTNILNTQLPTLAALAHRQAGENVRTGVTTNVSAPGQAATPGTAGTLGKRVAAPRKPSTIKRPSSKGSTKGISPSAYGQPGKPFGYY